MNTLYTIASSFIICSFAVLIINYFIPKGNLKQISSYVLVLFTLVCVLKPISDLKNINIKTDITETSISSENSTAGVIKSNIRKITDEVLKENGINNYELIIDIELKDNDLIINEYTILVDDINNSKQIKESVKERIGFEPEIKTF